MKCCLQFVAGAAVTIVATCGAPACAGEAGDTVVVLSASGGMKRAVQGRGALDLTREALGWRLGAGAAPGLVVFGGRKAKDCRDIDVVGKPGAVGAETAFASLAALKPLGQAPVAEAMRAAAGLLPAEKPGTLLLVTEGADTCKADPCAAAVELKRARPGLRIDVLGFDTKARDKLACLAAATGGTSTIAASTMDVFAALATPRGASTPAARSEERV